MLELDRTEYPVRRAILMQPIEHAGGIVRVPDGPALGIEIDRQAMARFAVGLSQRQQSPTYGRAGAVYMD
jgi:D-galactarolactone cycloisomerase